MRFERLGSAGKFALPLSLAAVLLLPSATLAEDAAQPSALDEEIRYINALTTRGYVDFAPAAIEAAQKKWPGAKGVLEAVTIRAELMGGKQDEVAKKIAARPDQNSLDTWLLKLELASSYALYSKYSDADKLYAEFFKRFTKVPKAAQKAYVDAIFQYISMLGRIDRAKDALPYYKLAMDQSPNEEMMYSFRADYLQAILHQAEVTEDAKQRETYLKDAETLAGKMVWRQDAYFGDAINGLAHVKMLRGDVKGAQELIQEYIQMLMDIHGQYKEMDPDGTKGVLRMSPLPQCRYLIGKMLYDQVKAEIAKGAGANEDTIKNLLLGERDPKTKKRNGQGAFNHLVNVYMNYPESQSASLAGDAVEEIQQILRDRYNANATVNVSADQRAKVRQQQYVGANVKFDAGDWDAAAEAFAQTISQYGLNAEAIPAMRKMIEAYVRGGVKGGKLDPMAQLNAETVTGALAEGFSGVENLYAQAGSAVSAIAAFYGEQGLKSLQDKTNSLFFRFYPKHPAAVSLQLKIAAEKAASNDADGAEKLYRQVADAATGDAQRDVRTKALSELVKLYQPSGAKPDVILEGRAAQEFVAHFKGIDRPGANAATAQFFLADACRHLAEEERKQAKGDEANALIQKAYLQAYKIYNELAKELAKDDSIYASTAVEKKQNLQLLEGSLYQLGVCMQRVPATGKKDVDSKIKATAKASFENYLKTFPKGKLAPASLLQIGTLEAASEDIEASRATLARLAKEFPQSDEAKNSIPLLADSLFKMGMKGEATNTYKQMFAAGGSYTPSQYLTAAEKLYDAKEYKLAVEAADSVLSAKGSTPYAPQAMLLRSRALLADDRVGEAYKQITAMLEKYGGTTSAVDANLVLIDIVGAQILNEKTFEARNKLIGEAKKSVTFITSHRKDDDAIAARLNLAVAEVARKAYESSVTSNADKEEIITAIGSALNAYRTAMFAGKTDVTDPSVTAFVQKAYLGYVQLSAKRAELSDLPEDKKAFLQDVVDLGTEYREKFPEGLYATEIYNAVLLARGMTDR